MLDPGPCLPWRKKRPHSPCVQAGLMALAVALVLLLAAPRAWADYYWKAGTLAPKRVGWARQVEEIVVPAIEQASGGQIRLKVFWGGSVGDDEHVIQKMKKDVLQIGGLAGQGTVMAIPEMNVLSLPFLFNNYDEVDFLRKKMHKTFESYARERGFVLFLWIDQDFDQIYSTRFTFEHPGDFAKSVFITWYGAMEERMLRSLGARTLAVDVPDVADTWRRGEADSAVAPALWMVGSQMYSVVKFVNFARIRYSPVVILNTAKSWDSVPKEYSAALWDQRMELSSRFVKDTRLDNEKAVEAMVQYGMKPVEMGPEALDRVKEKVMPLWGELAGVQYPKALLQEIEDILKSYRKTHAASAP